MGYNILVVDDISFNRTIMKEALKDMEDVEFLDAANGVQALDIIAEQEISLVILDLMMPIKDGFEVLRDLKSEVSFRDIPIIVYSAIDEADTISEAFKLGAYDYFTKPLLPKQVNVILPIKVRNALLSYEQHKTIQMLNEKMRMELLMANLFQQSLLSEKEEMLKATMYGKYIPSYEIGGDFYESFQVGDDVWFIMADVSGYGVSAAMLSSMLKIEFRHCAQSLDTPDQVLNYMNNTFCKITQSNYSLTAFVGVIRDHVLWYSNAGQPFPLVYSAANDSVQILRTVGFTLGMVENEKFGLSNMMLGANDIIMTYTDGLLEDKILIDSQGVYDDLANCFWNYRDVISQNSIEFFDILFRLFGNVHQKEANNDMAIMLICVK